MEPAPLSSGDLIADRRYDYALALAEAGDHAAAADLMVQALEIVPDWAAGWFTLGRMRQEAGDAEGAASAFERAAALDPDDRLGASLARARLIGQAPDRPPEGYVRALFDAYAGAFETALVDRLGYRAPALILSALDRAAPERRFRAALDLGCGTGLMGAAVRDRVGRLDGIDLSERMVAAARRKGCYDDCRVDEAGTALEAAAEGSLDLVLAADVFCYLGSLGPVFEAAARALEPGGVMAFTVERAADPDRDFELRDSLRYGHGAAALGRRLGAAGFEVVAIETADLRLDRGEPVGGLVVVAVRRADLTRS